MGTVYIFPEVQGVRFKYPKEPELHIFSKGTCECLGWHAGENETLAVICRYDTCGNILSEVPVKAVAIQVLEVAEDAGGGASAFRINLGIH